MAEDDGSPGVDVRNAPQRVDGLRDVLEGARPAAAVLPHSAVLDVPAGETAPGEVERERRHQRPIPALAPEAAVQEHDAWM
jgi:hypothetical protein